MDSFPVDFVCFGQRKKIWGFPPHYVYFEQTKGAELDFVLGF